MSHNIDGDEKPVAFTSRTLTTAEQKYFELDKRLLPLYLVLKSKTITCMGQCSN